MAEFEYLKEDYLDDILSSSAEFRKYRKIDNNDGTISLEDKSDYQQKGTKFSSKDIIATNRAINDLYRNRIRDLEQAGLVTEEGFFVDAKVFKELIDKFNKSKTWENIGTKTDRSKVYIDPTKYTEIFCELRLYDQYAQMNFPVTYIDQIQKTIEKSFCTGGYQTSTYPGVWFEVKCGKMDSDIPYIYFNRGFVNGTEIDYGSGAFGISVWGLCA